VGLERGLHKKTSARTSRATDPMGSQKIEERASLAEKGKLKGGCAKKKKKHGGVSPGVWT